MNRRTGPTRVLARRSMAKLLQLSRPSRRLGNVVRRWVALHLQKRRRRRAQGSGDGVPPQVVLNAGEFFAYPLDGAWVSVRLSWSYAAGAFPGGTFEIAQDLDGEGDFITRDWLALSEAVSSSGGLSNYEWVQDQATNTYAVLRYRVRCVHEGVEGAWSETCVVDINDRNYAFP